MAECNFNTSLQVLNIPPSGELWLLRGFYFILTQWHHVWMKGFLIFSVLLIFLFVTAVNAHFATGLEAYNSGDYATAIKEWKPLAEKGMADAQFNLAWMHYFGKGVKRSYTPAAKWFQLAADQGLADAQSNLGVMYREGLGVTQDYKNALKWLKLSAEQRNAYAQHHLGQMYRQGLGVTQDYKAANKWFQLAAEQGNAYAPSNLGDMYQQGYGVIQDYRRAHMWLSISASRGIKKSLVDRNMLELKMIPADIAKANELARECVAKNYKDC